MDAGLLTRVRAIRPTQWTNDAYLWPGLWLGGCRHFLGEVLHSRYHFSFRGQTQLPPWTCPGGSYLVLNAEATGKVRVLGSSKIEHGHRVADLAFTTPRPKSSSRGQPTLKTSQAADSASRPPT